MHGMINPILFYGLSALCLFSSLGVVFSKRPIYNVLLFLFFGLCIFTHMLLLKCSALACLYVLIYAGAMLVLFLFVLMLTLYDEQTIDIFGVKEAGHYSVYFTAAFVLLVIGLCLALVAVSMKSRVIPPPGSPASVSALTLSILLIKDYSLGLWLCAFLILTAVIGLSALARNRAP
jgi:NADH-quinone oxidoreductase subunit J